MSGGASAVGAARGLAAGALVFLLAAGAYVGTLGYPLVWDDKPLYALAESRVREGGLSGLLRAEFRPQAQLPTGYYRPVSMLSFWLDTVAGDPARSAHLQNVLLHALASSLAHRLLLLLLASPAAALAGGALFALHPVHVETVAFATGRTDILCAVFALLAAILWARERSGDAARRGPLILLSLTCWALACLSKEIALALPPVLLAWELLGFPRRELPWGRRLRENGAWLAGWGLVICALIALRWRLGIGWGSPRAAEAPSPLLLAGMLAEYARMALVPWPMNSWYTAAQARLTAGNATALLALAGGALLASAPFPSRLGLMALAWAGGFLAAVLGFVPIGGAVIAERFLYVPLLGLCVIVPALGARLAERLGGSRAARAVPAAALVLALGLCALATQARNRTWRSEETLLTEMVRTSPASPVARYNLGNLRLAAGDAAGAAEQFREALALDAADVEARLNLGVALTALGRHGEAAESYREALARRPESFDAAYNLANALAAQGMEAALPAYERALALRPASAAARYNYARALAERGRVAESRAQYRESLRLDPDAPDTLNNLAWLLATSGPGGDAAREAVALARRACELTGNANAGFLETLAVAQEAAGDRAGALATAQRALAAANAAGETALAQEIARRIEGLRAAPR